MKVLLVSEYFPPKIFGGGEISAQILSKYLRKNNIEVQILTSRDKNLKNYEEIEGIKIYRTLKTGSSPNGILNNIKRFYLNKSLIRELKSLDKKENFSVIHFLNTTSIPHFKFKTKAKKIATINSYTNFCPKRNMFHEEKTTCTGADLKKCIKCIKNSTYIGKTKIPKIFNNFISRRILYKMYQKNNLNLKNIDFFIAVSSYIGKLLEKSNIDKNKIKIIPNLMEIDNNISNPTTKNKLVTYIGNLEKIKGVKLLIKAFNEIEDKSIILLIVGKGSEKRDLEKVSNKNVKFLGEVDYKKIHLIYKKSAIIVLPTLWPEPLSRVMIEATYFGKPIIATNTGGNNEGVINSKNGYLVSPSYIELKDKIEMLIKDTSLLKKMGKESKKMYIKKFDNKTNISKIIKLYEEGF